MERFLITSILVFLYTFFLQAQFKDSILSVHEQQEDLKILLDEIIKMHPDKYLYTPQSTFDSIVLDVQKSILEPNSTIDFYRNLLPIVASIRNNHTDLLPSKDYMDYIGTEVKRLPMLFYYKKDSLFLLHNYSNNQSIKEGNLITKINGKQSTELLRSMSSLLSPDGYNENLSMYKVSKAFSRYYAYLCGTPGQFEIEFINMNGVKEIQTIESIRADSILKKIKSRFPLEALNQQLQIKGETAYLKVKSFAPKKIKVYNKFLKNSFKEMQDQNCKNLILDLRKNGGGYPEASSKLLSYLVDKEIYPIKNRLALKNKIDSTHRYEEDHMLKFFLRNKFEKEGLVYRVKNDDDWNVKPDKKRFSGNLFVLVDENCASATSSLMGQIKSHLPAVFIGRESGGNPCTVVAEFMLTLNLPNSKIRLKLPVIKAEKNVNFENTGRGIMPDHKVIPSIEDILNENDVVLKKAYELIEK